MLHMCRPSWSAVLTIAEKTLKPNKWGHILKTRTVKDDTKPKFTWMHLNKTQNHKPKVEKNCYHTYVALDEVQQVYKHTLGVTDRCSSVTHQMGYRAVA